MWFVANPKPKLKNFTTSRASKQRVAFGGWLWNSKSSNLNPSTLSPATKKRAPSPACETRKNVRRRTGTRFAFYVWTWRGASNTRSNSKKLVWSATCTSATNTKNCCFKTQKNGYRPSDPTWKEPSPLLFICFLLVVANMIWSILSNRLFVYFCVFFFI